MVLRADSPQGITTAIRLLSFISLIFLAVFIYLCFSIKQSYEALTWDVCPVEKVIKETKTHSSTSGTKTISSWTCYYTYQGQSYKTDKKGWGEFDSHKNTREVKHWQVYVNPKNPSEALLSQGLSASTWVMLSIFAATSFITTYLLFYLRALRKKNFSPQPPSAESRLRKDPSLSP